MYGVREQWMLQESQLKQRYLRVDELKRELWPKFHLARLDSTRLDTFDFVKPAEPVELVVSSESSCAVRLARHSQNASARHVERVESSRVEPSGRTAKKLYTRSHWEKAGLLRLSEYSPRRGRLEWNNFSSYRAVITHALQKNRWRAPVQLQLALSLINSTSTAASIVRENSYKNV